MEGPAGGRTARRIGSPQAPVATPAERLSARLKDNILGTILILIALGFPLAYDRAEIILYSFPAVIVLIAAHEVVCTAMWGQTLGKFLQGLMVVSADEGIPPGFARSFKRFGSAFVGCLPLISYFYPFGIFREDRRMWHDRRAGTIVIRIR